MNGTCRFCGCTDARGCAEGCFWVLPDVCSVCALEQLDAAGMKASTLRDRQEALSFDREFEADPDLPELWRPGMPL